MKKLMTSGALALALTGAGAAVVVAQDAPPTVDVAVGAKTMTVSGADALKTGPTKLRFTPGRGGPKGVAVVRLKDGVTPAAFAAAVPKLRAPEQAEQYGTFVASGFFASRYSTTIDLAEGDYALVDMSGKKPAYRTSFHAGPEAGTAVAPAADVKIGLKDYEFAMPSTLPRSGVFRVENDGKHLHHAIVMQFKKGVNTKAVLRKLSAGKEPRNAFAGPPSALVDVVSPETVNDVDAKLRPGKYLFACFLQNGPKAPPHVALGMTKVVTVK